MEWAQLPGTDVLIAVAWRLGSAALLGGLVGIERQWEHKAAGLRTHMTVALASSAFVVVMNQSGGQAADLSRVIQGLAAGVGFLGAGTILKGESESRIHGLTTAATIWLTAAIGVAAGAGQVAVAGISVIAAWIILAIFSSVDKLMNRRR